MAGRYVLIVDDDEGIRELAVTALRESGIAAESVADTGAALVRCRAAPPALILLDPMPQPLSEAAFIRAYRQLPGPQGPVLLFTASYEPEPHAAAIGADGVLPKPFELDEFVARVRDYLGRT